MKIISTIVGVTVGWLVLISGLDSSDIPAVGRPGRQTTIRQERPVAATLCRLVTVFFIEQLPNLFVEGG